MMYRVGTFREAGLQARWTKVNGAPFISARNPNAKHEHQRDKWWLVDRDMFAAMGRDGVCEAFDNFTLLGDMFSITK